MEINPSNNTPIFEQITNQVKYSVAVGAVRPGDLLPSIRQLAMDLLINPNTVARAYRDLEREGVLEMRRGLGAYVAPGAVPICKDARRKLISEKVRQVMEEAADASFSMEEIEKLVRQELDRIVRKRR